MLCPSSFTKLFYRTSRILYRCLGFVLKLPNSVCKEIVEKRSLFTKGKVLGLHPSRSKMAATHKMAAG